MKHLAQTSVKHLNDGDDSVDVCSEGGNVEGYCGDQWVSRNIVEGLLRTSARVDDASREC